MPGTPRPAPLETPTPLARWDDEASAPGLVWWAQLDDRYQVEVVRTGPAGDTSLRIFDHARGDVLLASHTVALTGDAEFGPAISDVVAWQRLAIETVDIGTRADSTSKETNGEDDLGKEAGAAPGEW